MNVKHTWEWNLLTNTHTHIHVLNIAHYNDEGFDDDLKNDDESNWRV